jgi:hypothetical protein
MVAVDEYQEADMLRNATTFVAQLPSDELRSVDVLKNDCSRRCAGAVGAPGAVPLLETVKRKLLVAGMATGMFLCPANASTITGQLSVFGTNILDPQAQTITFLSGNPFSPTATAPGDSNTVVVTETGDFLGLGTGGTLTWRNQGTPIGFNSLGIGSNLLCGDNCLFTGSNNGVTFSFNILSNSATFDYPTLTVLGSGIGHLTGFDPTPGIFSLTSQGGPNLGFTFTDPPAPVPGPIAGSGVPLLASGLIGLLALNRRRKRKTA